MSELLNVRTPYEVFPFGTLPARKADHDHVTRFRRRGAPPGQTRLDNIALLGRKHHRLKTHGGWLLVHPEPGTSWWRTRHGHWLRVDRRHPPPWPRPRPRCSLGRPRTAGALSPRGGTEPSTGARAASSVRRDNYESGKNMGSDTAALVDTIQKGTAVGALAFGVVGTLSPGTLTSIYGLKDDSGDFRYMGRMWGTRTAMIGVLGLTVPPGDSRRTLFQAAAAMNGIDALAVLSTKGLPARTRVMAALTSGGFAAAAVYALSLES